MDTLRILKELSALVRNETNWGGNTVERVGRTLVGIVEQLIAMEPSSSNQFTDLGGIPESEFDNVIKQGYYLYALQAGTGDRKGILVVSNDGDIRQIRYEFDGTYTRSRTDEGWEEWTDEFISKLRKHIDNDTIYWDDKNKVIKARGGASGTYSVTVDIDADSVGKCSVMASGEGVGISSNADESQYIVVVPIGGNATVNVIAAEGYQVKSLTVDGASKGSMNSFTFENVREGHAISVVMEVVEEIPVEFLVRSDLPDYYYSSTQDALNAVRASYPEGLTRDVTITCIKSAKEKRGGNIWAASLQSWNRGGSYMLVIDGAGRLTYNCKSGGGLRFDKVDNVVCRNIDFINFANGVEAYSPDELSAITFLGDSDVAARNLYVENCRMNGVSTSQADKKAYYSVITKNSENVYIVGSHIEGCYCIPLKMVDCGMLALVRNYIRADYSYGIIGHPALCTLSNCKVLIAEDNEFTGDTAEYYFCCERTERMYFRRNTWHGGRGRAIDMSNTQTAVKEFVFESNLSYDMIKSPSAGWVKELFSVSLLESLSLLNNTFVMSGEWYYQYILRADAVGTANIYNNILVGDSGQTGDGRFVEGYYFDTLRALNSGNNLYQFPVKDASAGIAHRNYITVVNTNNNADSLTMKGTERGSLTALNALGYETGSNLVAPSVTLLDAEYRPKANFSYYSNDGYVPFADADYKAKAVSDNSRGCYNLAGMAIDEVNDATEGYTGIDYDEGGCAGFSSAAQHPVIAESVLLVMHNTRNRERFIRMSVIGKQHEYLMLGRYGLLRVMPVLDGDGEYVEDELYTVNIE